MTPEADVVPIANREYKLNKDAYWRDVTEGALQRLTTQDAAELTQILASHVVRKALRIAVDDMNAATSALLNTDFTDPSQVTKAISLQGQVRGGERFLETLIDLSLCAHSSQMDKESTDHG